MNTQMNTNDFNGYGRANFGGRGGFRGRGRGRGYGRGYGGFRGTHQDPIKKCQNQLNFYNEIESIASIIKDKPIKVERDDSKNFPNEYIGIVEIAKINKLRVKKGMEPLTEKYYGSKGIMTTCQFTGKLIPHTNQSFFKTMSSMNILIRQDTSSGKVKIMVAKNYSQVISIKKKPIQDDLFSLKNRMKNDETSSSSSSEEEEEDGPKKEPESKKADNSSSDEEDDEEDDEKDDAQKATADKKKTEQESVNDDDLLESD